MRSTSTKLLGAAAAAALLVTAVACGSSAKTGQSPTTTAPPAASTTAPVVSSTTTTRPAEATADVRVYFMGGDRIGVAHRTVTATPQVAGAAMAELLAGPSPADRAAGMATAIPPATRLLGINVDAGVATVDLSGAFQSGGGSLSMIGRLAQVTYTLTQFPNITGVVFHLDGKAVRVFGGEGIILDHPATRAGFESVTPPILVEYPGAGWAVQTPLRVTGTANVFEAQFRADLTDGSGRIIASQTVHATSGTGTRGTFDASIGFPDSARGPATLTVYDISPKDGSRIDVVIVPLNLSGS